VLERDVKRTEVLPPTAKPVGKIGVGKDAKTGQKRLENVFRRSDLRVVRSADAWYRLGREVKPGVIPWKIRPPTKRRKRDDSPFPDEGDQEEAAGVPLYTEEQTDLYVPPPVVGGRVPRNVYGNLDVYVPSMVPEGGVHIPFREASYAARLLGIDYADAVTGFEFRGRHGTAVLKGVVVAEEYKEAMEAVIDGLRDAVREAQEVERRKRALRMWRHFMIGLRVKERVDMLEVEGERDYDAERAEKAVREHHDGDVTEKRSLRERTGMRKVVEDSEDDNEDEEGGGFLPDDREKDEDAGMESEEYDMDEFEGGGFVPESDEDDEAGGFIPE
jgi:xeroderma pigmentosum group C-complementing protein